MRSNSHFAAHYERIFPFRPATFAFLRRQLPARGRVLDLGCGPGHYAGALAAAGLEAIGLDLDPAMIDMARRRYAGAHFAVADLTETRSICPHADGAFCLGNVLPHLPPARLAVFFADLAAVLPPDAPWIVQTVNFDRLLPLRAPHDLPALDAGDGLVFRRRYEPGARDELRFFTSLARGEKTISAGEVVLWPLASRDLAAVHTAAGFELREEHGDFAGEAFAAARSSGCVQVYRRLG